MCLKRVAVECIYFCSNEDVVAVISGVMASKS